MSNEKKNWKSKVLTIGSWIVGAALLVAGATKLAGSEQHAASFAEFGLPLWLMYVVGATEVAGGIMLAIGRTRFVAAVMLAGTMVGAVGSHLSVGHGADTIPAAVLLVALAAIAYATRDQLGELMRRLSLRPSA
jgi:uncharacterized membrane protein YphA (DoxX/SURF4 family)